MLKLRQEHLQAFEAQVARLFAARLAAHLKVVWPGECAELGEAALDDTVRNGIQRAAAIGLTSEHDVARFVDLAFLLVKDFETNPLSSWTRPILADRKLAPEAKLERLYQRMEEEFAAIEKRKAGKP